MRDASLQQLHEAEEYVDIAVERLNAVARDLEPLDLERAVVDVELAHLRASQRSLATIRRWFGP